MSNLNTVVLHDPLHSLHWELDESDGPEFIQGLNQGLLQDGVHSGVLPKLGAFAGVHWLCWTCPGLLWTFTCYSKPPHTIPQVLCLFYVFSGCAEAQCSSDPLCSSSSTTSEQIQHLQSSCLGQNHTGVHECSLLPLVQLSLLFATTSSHGSTLFQ